MARNFSGTQDFENTSPGVFPTTPYTFQAWFNVDVGATLDAIFVYSGNTGISELITLLARGDSGDTLRFGRDDGTTYSETNATNMTYTEGVWNHALGTSTGAANATCFLNGAASGTSTTSHSPAPTNVLIGRDADGGNSFNGDIAECALWNHASTVLTQEEIDALASGVSPLLIRPAELVFYAPLLTGGVGNEADIVGGLILTEAGVSAQAVHPPIFMPSGQLVMAPSPPIQTMFMPSPSWI